MNQSYRLAVFGPQGSGKGTQAELLSKELNIPHICSGDLLREEIKAKTELGQEVEKYVNSGELVPQKLIYKLIENRLKQPDTESGFIIDGFPRSKEQAEFLAGITSLSKVVLIDIDKEEVFVRLSSRRICNNCGEIYNLIVKKPKEDGVCDKCKGKLIQREDEKPEAIRKRLAIYEAETKPMLDFYKNKGILLKINGKQPIEKVFLDIKNFLNI